MKKKLEDETRKKLEDEMRNKLESLTLDWDGADIGTSQSYQSPLYFLTILLKLRGDVWRTNGWETRRTARHYITDAPQ